MDNQEDGLLDDLRPALDVFSNLPPAIVSFERVFFIVWNVFSYCCVLMSLVGLVDDSGWMLAVMMQIGIACWQVVSAIICNGIYKSPLRSIYNNLLMGYVAAGHVVFVLMRITSSEVGRIVVVVLALLGVFVAPQALNWFYWYVSYTEAKIRQEMLAQRNELIEEERQKKQPE